MGKLDNDRINNLLKLYIDSNKDKDFYLSRKRDACLICNLLGQIVYANHGSKELTGYKDDLLSKGLRDLFIDTELDENQAFFKDRAPETLNYFRSKLISQSGRTIEVNVAYFPIYFMDEYVGTYITIKE
ncbi:PAS domain S-box-containing protein [Mesobacillus persicus]|uniref:PAS domain S-box-containing protein n=1 Tax=Mesobacillus persicus TaxID=930146 RepID=A0A1H8CEJ1_9BACI|nr:PAS domain-containing protein [Mesobacillus persicus]SEM93410.1 PAS domain S-box-containing protein [Mesobacillus persicus]